MRPSPGWG